MEISTIKDIKVGKLRFIPDVRATCFMVSLSSSLVGQTPTRIREKVLQRIESFSYKKRLKNVMVTMMVQYEKTHFSETPTKYRKKRLWNTICSRLFAKKRFFPFSSTVASFRLIQKTQYRKSHPVNPSAAAPQGSPHPSTCELVRPLHPRSPSHPSKNLNILWSAT